MPLGAKPNDPKAVQRHDGSWLLDGMLSVDEFREIFHLESLPGEKKTPTRLWAVSCLPRWDAFRPWPNRLNGMICALRS